MQRLISSTPQGTIFQFAFCLLLYNLLQVVRGYIAQAQQLEPETISTEMVFNDVHRQLISLTELAEHVAVVEYFQQAREKSELVGHIQALLKDVWHDRWIKSPKKKKFQKPQTTNRVKGGHTSIYRIIQESKQKPSTKKQRCSQQ